MIKKNCDKGYILEVDVDYPSKLHKLHNDMSFSPERMKIDKTQKLVCNLHDNYIKTSIKSWVKIKESA